MKNPWVVIVDTDEEDDKKIKLLVKEGHTRHCACRKIWGDGECSCNKSGTPISKRMEGIIKLIRNHNVAKVE